MTAFLPTIVAAGAVMIVLLCTSSNQVSGEPKQRAEAGLNELERWRP
jgi:hypothetical protein